MLKDIFYKINDLLNFNFCKIQDYAHIAIGAGFDFMLYGEFSANKVHGFTGKKTAWLIICSLKKIKGCDPKAIQS